MEPHVKWGTCRVHFGEGFWAKSDAAAHSIPDKFAEKYWYFFKLSDDALKDTPRQQCLYADWPMASRRVVSRSAKRRPATVVAAIAELMNIHHMLSSDGF